MKINIQSPLQMFLLSLILIFQFSCSKDSDLLAEYVIADAQEAILIDDIFVVSLNGSTVLDVLANDTFENEEEVVITETSTPTNGTVEINSDNTLTYTPETTVATVDTFTYTTEVVNTDETVSTETSNVTVTLTEDLNKTTGGLKAFPGAFGFGRNTTGGRGGYVYEVTNLNSSGPGSLAYGLEELSGARTIIFKVGGIIHHSGSDIISVRNGDVTIAGQTAPGDGILIRGELRIQASNVIVRHIRLRSDNGTTGTNLANVRIAAYSGKTIGNVILDHLSMSWAKDESLTITEAGNETGRIENITVQNCFITDNIKNGYNVILFQNCYDVSFYQNLLGYSKERNVRASDCGNRWEMINNYIYSFQTAALGTYENTADVIGNRWDTGSQTQFTNHIFDLSPSKNNCPDSDNSLSKVYYSDNLKNGTPGTYGNAAKQALKSNRQVVSDIVPYPALDVKDKVLGNAGAYHGLPQGLDSFDEKRMNDINLIPGKE